jgi:hypothetical protein
MIPWISTAIGIICGYEVIPQSHRRRRAGRGRTRGGRAITDQPRQNVGDGKNPGIRSLRGARSRHRRRGKNGGLPHRSIPVSGPEAIAEAPMAFVGYGVTAPERGWDDFKGVDLHGARVARDLGVQSHT